MVRNMQDRLISDCKIELVITTITTCTVFYICMFKPKLVQEYLSKQVPLLREYFFSKNYLLNIRFIAILSLSMSDLSTFFTSLQVAKLFHTGEWSVSQLSCF